MGRTSGPSFNRKQLLVSEMAVCYYCFKQFNPSEVLEWCDGDQPGQTAICPYCSVDSVVGWNGPVDTDWVAATHKTAFSGPTDS
jgi:hypothetical protein